MLLWFLKRFRFLAWGLLRANIPYSGHWGQ